MTHLVFERDPVRVLLGDDSPLDVPGTAPVVVELPDGVTVVALHGDMTVTLVKEYRFGVQRTSLECVSGGIKNGECAQDAAWRELREETGITARVVRQLSVISPFTAYVRSKSFLYVAEGLGYVDPTPDDGEVVEPVRMPFDAAVRLVLEGEIVHGPSCVAILLVDRMLSQPLPII